MTDHCGNAAPCNARSGFSAAAMRWLGGAAACAAACGALAAGQLVEDIQVSRRGDQATITLELGCPMRFQSDAPTQQGVLIEVRVAPLDACRELGLGNSISSEAYRPVGGQIAHLLEVEYESLGLGDNLLLLRFDQPISYRVAQRGDLRTLQLIVQLAGTHDVTSTEPTTAPPSAPAPSAPRKPRRQAAREPARTPADRAPLSVRVREPHATADYVVNLESTRTAVDPKLIEALAVPAGAKPYVSTTEVDGQVWYRLRIGFFDSEEAARAALAPLAERFPKAWIGRAEADEVEVASNARFSPGDTVDRTAPAPRAAKTPSAPTAEAPVVATAEAAAGSLSSERLAELATQGRQALLNHDYGAAIRIYTRLVQEPGEQRAEARELLGLARERNGQAAYARAEYQAYLAEFPDGDGARRVRQRLNALAAGAAPRTALRELEPSARGPWQVTSGISQYYLKDIDQFDQAQPKVVSLEALLTDVDFSVRRSGERVNLQTRVSASDYYDLSQQPRGDLYPPNRVTYAYFDVDDARNKWALRVGRQTLHDWGVLGRFDGAHFWYEWAPNRRVHFTAGYPVESTRYGVETDRRFVGAAVDFDHLIGAWDFSTFVNTQTIEGVSDRQAVGAEVRYLDERRSLTSMLDYDRLYGTLNTALVLGTWQLPGRMTLTALVDHRMSPVLTTRNALIGQPVTTIQELLQTLTEDQVQQVARDRTPETNTATFGFWKPLFQRFQVNGDVTTTEIAATPASLGVQAIPGTGRQIYYSTTFVGSGLFGENDVTIFNLRYGVAPDFTTSQLTWDGRFAVSRRIRLNPRLRFALWESATGRTNRTVGPAFRLLVNMPRHYRIEAELGSDDYLRTDPFTTKQQANGTYVNIGYRADF